MLFLAALLLVPQITLHAAPPAQKPGPVVAGKEEAVVTGQWAVQLRPGANPNVVAVRYGLVNLGQIGRLENFYLFAPPETGVQADTSRLRTAAEVVWLEQQVAYQQSTRAAPTDPYFGDQWHLKNTGQAGGAPGQDVNVLPAWNRNMTGAGIVIGVVDDGLQYTHPDLSSNYLAGASWDFNENDPDPSPGAGNFHGTSVSGVAAARDNATCGVGVAFRAGLAGLRLIAAPSTDAQEAAALTHDDDTIDIFSNSWGPTDNGATLMGPGPLARAALEVGVTRGRDGLGNIYVWAAGNGLYYKDNVNYDGYANSPFTIAVGAVDNTGRQAWYSEPGAAMLVTAPSSGSLAGITTTDLFGNPGYSAGDCTATFGGTSAAAPLVAGVIALMLEANPDLTWRDVQHILVKTAVKNDPSDSDWATNEAGYGINHKYGFGRVNAGAAVEAALTWSPIAPATSLNSKPVYLNQIIPDNDTTGLTTTLTVSQSMSLEHVEVVVDISHPYRGDLEIVLISPAGTQSFLAEPRRDFGNNYDSWRFMTVRNWGESSQGTWTLEVKDKAALDAGQLHSWQLILHGTDAKKDPPDDPETLIYYYVPFVVK
jgi:subtilisin-like proprotein convertase family protein